MFTGDFDIGFITTGGVSRRSSVGEIKAVAVIGSSLGVIEHSLVGYGDIEDSAQEVRCFSSGDTE